MTKPDITQLDDGIVLVNKISAFFPDGFECEYYEANSERYDRTYYISETIPPCHIFDIVHGSYEYRITVDEPHTGDSTAWIESANYVEDPEREHSHTSITTDKLSDCLENSINYIKEEFMHEAIEPITIGEFVDDVIKGCNGAFTIKDDDAVVDKTTDETDQLITEEDCINIADSTDSMKFTFKDRLTDHVVDEAIDETITVDSIEVGQVKDEYEDEDDGFVYECAYTGCDETVTLEHRYNTIRHDCESCDRTTQFERTEG